MEKSGVLAAEICLPEVLTLNTINLNNHIYSSELNKCTEANEVPQMLKIFLANFLKDMLQFSHKLLGQTLKLLGEILWSVFYSISDQMITVVTSDLELCGLAVNLSQQCQSEEYRNMRVFFSILKPVRFLILTNASFKINKLSGNAKKLLTVLNQLPNSLIRKKKKSNKLLNGEVFLTSFSDLVFSQSLHTAKPLWTPYIIEPA